MVSLLWLDPEACPTCRHFACICEVVTTHTESCLYRLAVVCPVAIACEPHKRDVCPVCDPCECGHVED